MARLQGRVVDYETDAPVKDVTVSLANRSGDIVATAKTNADGAYVIEHVSADDPYFKVKFSGEGYAAESMQPASANNVDVVLRKSNVLSSVTVIVKNYKSYIIAVAVILLLVILYLKLKK